MTINAGVQLQATAPVQVNGFVHIICQESARLPLEGNSLTERVVLQETLCTLVRVGTEGFGNTKDGLDMAMNEEPQRERQQENFFTYHVTRLQPASSTEPGGSSL